VQLVSKIFDLCGHDPPTSQDGETDRQMTCDRKTALCTIVHRVVKNRIPDFSATPLRSIPFHKDTGVTRRIK